MLRIRHEVVICAAIRLPDGRVFRGHRHGDCIRTAQLLVEHEYLTHQLICPPEEIALDYDKGWRAEMARDQGFITSANRYVDRQEGMRLQLTAGIESVAEGGYRGSTLFSEDLY